MGRSRYPSVAEGQRLKMEWQKADEALLTAPRPATVSLAHFVRRGLAADIAAGRCVVTFHHSIGAPAVVRDVRPDGNIYVITPQVGYEWRAFKATLVVNWLPD